MDIPGDRLGPLMAAAGSLPALADNHLTDRSRLGELQHTQPVERHILSNFLVLVAPVDYTPVDCNPGTRHDNL